MGSCCLTSSLEGREAERYPLEGTTWAWWLWRDYIDEVVFSEGLHEKEAAAMSGGCTGKRFACKLQIGQSAKLDRREIALYGTRSANTLCQGPVAAETQVAASCRLADSGPGVAHSPSSGSEGRWSGAAWALGGGFEGLGQVTRQARWWVRGSSILLRASALRQVSKLRALQQNVRLRTVGG